MTKDLLSKAPQPLKESFTALVATLHSMVLLSKTILAIKEV